MNATEARSARLLFGEELALGEVREAELDVPDVTEAVRDRPVPSALARRMQRRALARGRLDYEQFSVAPMLAARAAVLGERAAGPPRFLVRVDGGDDGLHRFLREHEVPFLSRGERQPLLELEVAVPAGEALDADTYAALAGDHAVVTGGVGSVPGFGWHPTPLWRGGAVYAPAYLAGAGALAAVQRLIAQQAALWVPVVVRSMGDAATLAPVLRGYAREWDEFLAAVRASR